MGEQDGWRSTPTARGAKRLALSIGGGAAITLLGASAAHAQDATSQGGDATATGNHSASDQGQTMLVTPGSDPTVGSIHGTVEQRRCRRRQQRREQRREHQQPIQRPPAVADGQRAETPPPRATSPGASSTRPPPPRPPAGASPLIGQDAHIGNWGGALADSGFNSGDGTVSGNADAWGNRSDTWITQMALVNDGSGSTRLLTQEAQRREPRPGPGRDRSEHGRHDHDRATRPPAATSPRPAPRRTGSSPATPSATPPSTRRRAPATVAGPSPTPGLNQTTGDGSINDAKVFHNGVLIEGGPAEPPMPVRPDQIRLERPPVAQKSATIFRPSIDERGQISS